MPGKENLIIVLDPGHGGANEGLTHNGLVEKDMNLVTANAMRDELLQYDHVEVYITNPDKADMSLKQRAQYAESVEADVLISLHFNMSEEHRMYGSEVWVQSSGLAHAKMHALGDVFLEQFAEKGFTIRGVKTRLNDEGLDYYGILRESAALSIPAVLVEHGYADHERDYSKMDSEDDWKELGRMDATAVAKYYGLTSASLGRDYSSYVKNGYFAPEQPVAGDGTPPEEPVLLFQAQTEAGAVFTLSARETESMIVYYDYTTDGGKTWSEVLPFENGKTSMEFVIPDVTAGSHVSARVYNGYFLSAQTNEIVFAEPSQFESGSEAATEGETVGPETLQEEYDTAGSETLQGTEYAKGVKSTVGGYGVMLLWGGFALLLSFLLFLTAYLTCREQRKRKHSFRGELRQIERICFVLGIAAMLLGISVVGIGYSRQKAAQGIETGSVTQADGTGEVYIKSGAEETGTEETGTEEADTGTFPLLVDTTHSAGYEETEDGKSVQGESLLSMHKRNTEAGKEAETMVVYDIAEGFLRVPLLTNASRNSYETDGFSGSALSLQYKGSDGTKTKLGIDVSKFQGNIDWQQVKEAGIEFVILRAGLRGYGSGKLVTDERFNEHYRGASEAGLEIGVYFFSAAVNEEEAVAEADYVLSLLADHPVTMPVVFDTEPIYYDDARTDDLTPDELTAITKAFCERIRQSGLTPMIYANAKRFTTVLHLEALEEYEKWLADYRERPDYPYHFSMWQFTEQGRVPGIEGNVDIDLFFYKE